MRFNVSELLKEPSGSTRTYQTEERLAALDGWPEQQARVTVRMLRTGEGIWVSASLDSETRCVCSRCLVEFRQPIQAELEEEYFPIALGRTEARGLEPVDESQYIDLDNILDLSAAVRQYSALAAPMKPVCKEGCAGICPNCGANLNEESCRCPGKLADPRWAPLQDLVLFKGATERASK